MDLDAMNIKHLQTPFLRPTVRPNGSFKSLPQKQFSIKMAATKKVILNSFALVALTCGLNASTIIDTSPGNTTIGPFSDQDWATWGQTFQTPLGENHLASFSVTLNVQQTGEFAFFVMAWTGTRAAGPVLFESDPVIVEPGDGQVYTFDPGITLTPGQQYVAFVNSSAFQSTGNFLVANVCIRTDNPYPAGQIVGHVNRAEFNSLIETDWPIPAYSDSDAYADIDLVIRAVFTPTPVPISIDVRPGTPGNHVNLKSQGVLRVALHSTSLFDATTVITSSLTLGPGSATPLLKPKPDLKDVDGDGRLDLLVFFHTRDLGLTPEAEQLILTGTTSSGTSFAGTCAVTVRP